MVASIITPAISIAGVIVVAALLLAPPATAPAVAEAMEAMGAGEHNVLRIHTGSGVRLIRVELALDDATQRRGLMFRRHLAADTGMLFVYTPARRIAMWMKNTYIPLDMLFCDEAGRIIKIAEHTEPFSLQTISADGPVHAVLEVNAGTTARLGIRPGDRIAHPLFRVAP